MRGVRGIGLATLAFATVAFAAFGTVRAEEKRSGKGERVPEPANDREFVLTASAGGLAELDAANLALRQARSEDVKKFARHVVDDHAKANEQLNQLADRKRFPVAQAADARHQQMLTRMAALTGENFDRRFMDDQVRDHERTIARFEWAAKNAQDADLKSWADKTLPTLRDHLKAAKEVQGKVGGGRRDGERTRRGEVDRGDRPARDRNKDTKDRTKDKPDKDK